MHEHGVVSHAFNALREAAGGRQIKEVTVALGPGMQREATVAAWDHMAEGTTVAAAIVNWQTVGDLLQCLECATEFRGERIDTCPRCSGVALVVEAAAEIAIEDWVLEESG
jgi:Zn finger protein HypA/HybF involved in hydrogenase expression